MMPKLVNLLSKYAYLSMRTRDVRKSLLKSFKYVLK